MKRISIFIIANIIAACTQAAGTNELWKPECVVVTPTNPAPQPYVIGIEPLRMGFPNATYFVSVQLNFNIYTNHPPELPYFIAFQLWDPQIKNLTLNCPLNIIQENGNQLRCWFVIGEEHMPHAYLAYGIPNPKREGYLIYLYRLDAYCHNQPETEKKSEPSPPN